MVETMVLGGGGGQNFLYILILMIVCNWNLFWKIIIEDKIRVQISIFEEFIVKFINY